MSIVEIHPSLASAYAYGMQSVALELLGPILAKLAELTAPGRQPSELNLSHHKEVDVRSCGKYVATNGTQLINE